MLYVAMTEPPRYTWMDSLAGSRTSSSAATRAIVGVKYHHLVDVVSLPETCTGGIVPVVPPVHDVSPLYLYSDQ